MTSPPISRIRPISRTSALDPIRRRTSKARGSWRFWAIRVTTDHISPAGAIPEDYPAGQYLIAQGVDAAQFNSYGSRRGNHEVMMRGTFGNIRMKNRLVAARKAASR